MKKRLLFILLIVSLLFTSCSSVDERKETEGMVMNTILSDSDISFLNLINEGFPIDHIDENGESLLLKAIKQDSKRIVKAIVERKPELIKSEYIFSANSLYVFDSLVRNGVSLDTKNDLGDPLLIHLIKNQSNELLKYALNNGVDIKALDREGWPALFHASKSGNSESIKELIKSGANPLIKDAKGNPPIYYADNMDNILALYKYNYRMSDKNISDEVVMGEVYLHSVKAKEYDVIKSLLSRGVDKNYRSYGKGALDIARENNDTEMLTFLEMLGVN